DENGRVGVATLLTHESGEYIEFDPVFMKADKETAQGAGALITYLKRYTLSAIFGITSDQDDDGNSASGNQQVKTSQQDNYKPVTQKQVGLIRVKAKEFAKLRNQDEPAVFKALNISDVTKISQDMASKTIKTLESWIAKANEKK